MSTRDPERPFELKNRGAAVAASQEPETSAPSVDVESTPAGAEPTPGLAAEPSPPTPRTAPRRWIHGLLAASVAAAALAGAQWWSSAHDAERERAELRDQALVQGTRAVETINTMDYRDIEGGMKRWTEVATGVLQDQFASASKEQRDFIADAGKVTTARVVSAALTELTDDTATLITAIEVTVAGDPAEKPAVKRNRYSADLVLVDSTWKLENIQQVRVSL